MVLRNIKRFLKSNILKFSIATVLVLFILLFTDIPKGFTNILLASQISGVDDEGRPLYMHPLYEEEAEVNDDFTTDHANEPTDFETEISKKLSGFDSNEWNLILVNKENPLIEYVDCDLREYQGFDVDARIYDNLVQMFEDAQNDGVNLFMASGYRDYNTQNYLYEKKINYFKKLGYPKDEAVAIASMKVTPPLTSEHETGLAVDILSYEHSKMDPEFGESEAGKWLYDNAYKYGFILRYPYGVEEITQIQYEPWHFRYVGFDAAEYIFINDLTFEEFHELISQD